MPADKARGSRGMPGEPGASFFCDVILSDAAQAPGDAILRLEPFLQELGAQVYSHRAHKENNAGSWASSLVLASPAVGNGQRGEGAEVKVTRAMQFALTELVTTERSYVSRIEALYHDKDTQIIPARDAERLFGNLGEIVAVNKMLLVELEILFEQGFESMAASIGDVMAQNMHRFRCYDEYMGDFAEAKAVGTKLLKNKAFRGFIEHATPDVGNSGLRELMMEPLQRIPRYRMLMNAIMKEMPSEATQYQRLHDASTIAGHIAAREVSSTTRRAAILWSCSQATEHFPADLAESRRELLGCIDVDEGEAPLVSMLHALGSAFGSRKKAHAYALLVFDDVLVVVQRHTSQATPDVLHLHEPEWLADRMRKAQLESPFPKKGLSFVGAYDLAHIKAVLHDGRLDVTMGETLRCFRDANGAQPHRMALFVDCIWKAQAVHRARARAMQVRAGTVPGTEHRAPYTLLWTLLSLSQFQRFSSARDVLVYMGPVAAAREIQRTNAVETLVVLELGREKQGTITVLGSYGLSCVTMAVALHDVPSICADLCANVWTPPAHDAASDSVASDLVAHDEDELPEVPVRRQSLRSTRRSAPGSRARAHERVRASMQSPLEAVAENQHEDAPSPGPKRARSEPEIETPKRRALGRVDTEEEIVLAYEAMDTASDVALSPAPSATSPERNALKMRAEDTQDLPNPFEDTSDSQEEMDEAEVQAQLNTSSPAPEPVKGEASDESDTEPMPSSRSERDVAEPDMDLTVLRLLHEEQANGGMASPPAAAQSESDAMRAAIARVNERVALLCAHRPASPATGWQEDWAQFKQAIKALNVNWTRMERAYENKQMELAAYALADDEVKLSPEAYAALQDEANMLVPLRLEISQLTKRCAALAQLEKDARLENAELYKVFNEELAQLYQHSFRPADEEISMLRQALVEAKTALHTARVENRYVIGLTQRTAPPKRFGRRPVD